MDKVAVSRALASLCRRQRVERRIEEADRRRSRLRLTPAGAALYAEIAPCALAYEDAMLRGLPTRSRKALSELLDDLMLRALAARSAITEPPTTTAAAVAGPPANNRTLRTSRG